jgi:hypothetical protein
LTAWIRLKTHLQPALTVSRRFLAPAGTEDNEGNEDISFFSVRTFVSFVRCCSIGPAMPGMTGFLGCRAKVAKKTEGKSLSPLRCLRVLRAKQSGPGLAMPLTAGFKAPNGWDSPGSLTKKVFFDEPSPVRLKIEASRGLHSPVTLAKKVFFGQPSPGRLRIKASRG